MPATEQTSYDQKVLHLVFAASSLVMLIATVWMFANDHNREWKGYQIQYREVDQRSTAMRRDQANSQETRATDERLAAELREIRSSPPDRRLFDEFKAEVVADMQRREANNERTKIDFEELNSEYQELESLAAAAAKQRDVTQKLKVHLQAATEALAAATSAETPDEKAIAQAAEAEKTTRVELGSAQAALIAAEEKAGGVRQSLLSKLKEILAKAKFREKTLAGDRKFKNADLDAARASFGMQVRDGYDEEQLAAAQKRIDPLKQAVAELSLRREIAAAHAEALQAKLDAMTADEAAKQKERELNMEEYDRLVTTFHERKASYFDKWGLPGKRFLELPIIDAFGNPLKIDNLWTEGLKQPVGSFAPVRRFDRCTTCHKGIEQTMPGSATEPKYVAEHELQFTLFTPESAPELTRDDGGNIDPPLLEQVYGIRLAARGLLSNDDVTVKYVEPGSLGAKAIMQVRQGGQEHENSVVEHGFQVGDVIEYVREDDKILTVDAAVQALTEGVTWGQPISVTIRRGLPNPFTSHPRLDLFVGSLSPHKLAAVGCTVCHEGQGSATSFTWASHSPSTPDQGEEWTKEHGWFNNHHWIYPMYPKRFAESACLKCHHNVTELKPSARFPEPPAPKVTAGHELVLKYGCFGCHEINGYDGSRRIGPDLRLEPNFHAVAAALKGDANFQAVDAHTKSLVDTLIQHPEDDATRRELRTWLLDDAQAESPQLSAESHAFEDALKDVDFPGQLRKVGPSLRHVRHKLGFEFLVDWIQNPRHFRPSTRMPRFFNQWDHLVDESDRAVAEEREPIEIVGIAYYLTARSQNFSFLTPVVGTNAGSKDEQVARGKVLFETRGCLNCHKHQDFPNAASTFGPDLSGIGDKLSAAAGSEHGSDWLYSWIKAPTHYNPRTKMPDLFLNPITDEEGQVTDPAADIAEYLLTSSTGWKMSAAASQAIEVNDEAVDRFVLENMRQAFYTRSAEQYLETGVPESLRDSLKGAEVEMIGPPSMEKKLLYVGRKSIGKYGCYACHDIPGFETAKTIGTALAEWGRKDPSKLAFEHILEYLHQGHNGHGNGEDAANHAGDADADHDATGTLPPDAEQEFDDSYFRQKLEEHERTGFIWQKLKEPRSYDYKKTANKRYAERLRMPLFRLNDVEREQVITFVLGLVADPPAVEFVYRPADAESQALVEGRAVIEKYNCQGCHIFELEQWELEFKPGDITPQPPNPDFPFVTAQFTPEELAKSARPDLQRGVLRATITGLPAITEDTGKPVIWDDEGDPLEEDISEYDPQSLQYRFELWKPVAIDGNPYRVGPNQLTVPASTIRRKRPGWGGDLTRLLLSRVVELEGLTVGKPKGKEAWGWLPPPLVGEGRKVQPDWLHSFLLDPHPIRPAVFLRMPKFNMSSEEATKIVNYFAARDGGQFPFELHQRQTTEYLAEADRAFKQNGRTGRLEQAIRIVTNANYCVKCHSIGDYRVKGGRELGPELTIVNRRLQPAYVRNWIANPKTILPYTGMPVNIPYDASAEHLGGVDQAIYPGTSVQQLDAVVDLLMNFPAYTSSQANISEMVKESAPPAGEAPPDTAADSPPAEIEQESAVVSADRDENI